MQGYQLFNSKNEEKKRLYRPKNVIKFIFKHVHAKEIKSNSNWRHFFLNKVV